MPTRKPRMRSSTCSESPNAPLVAATSASTKNRPSTATRVRQFFGGGGGGTEWLPAKDFPKDEELPSDFITKNLDEDHPSTSSINSTPPRFTYTNVASTTSSPSRPQFFIGSAPPSPSSSDDGSHHELGSPLTLTVLPTFSGSPRRKGRPPAIRIPSRDEEGLAFVGAGGAKKVERDVFGGVLGAGVGAVGMGIGVGDVFATPPTKSNKTLTTKTALQPIATTTNSNETSSSSSPIDVASNASAPSPERDQRFRALAALIAQQEQLVLVTGGSASSKPSSVPQSSVSSVFPFKSYLAIDSPVSGRPPLSPLDLEARAPPTPSVESVFQFGKYLADSPLLEVSFAISATRGREIQEGESRASMCSSVIWEGEVDGIAVPATTATPGKDEASIITYVPELATNSSVVVESSSLLSVGSPLHAPPFVVFNTTLPSDSPSFLISPASSFFAHDSIAAFLPPTDLNDEQPTSPTLNVVPPSPSFSFFSKRYSATSIATFWSQSTGYTFAEEQHHEQEAEEDEDEDDEEITTPGNTPVKAARKDQSYKRRGGVSFAGLEGLLIELDVEAGGAGEGEVEVGYF